VTFLGGDLNAMAQFAGVEAVPGVGLLSASMPAPAAPTIPLPVGAVGVTGRAGTGAARPSSDVLCRQTGALLQYCYRWLEQAVPVMPQLADVVPALVTAVHQYEAQQYEASLAQTLGVVRVLHQVRLAVPALPAL
jgi:hypothetical protein